jgi:segregation and condensation protein B
MENLKHIIESLLFVAEEPLTIERIRNIIAVVTPDEVRSALTALSDEYDTREGGFYLREVAGGYQLRTRPEYTQWIKRLVQPKQQRLSKAALETLAIVAYKQPAMRSDIEYIRGVDCGGILRMLLERKLIRILGRKELPGRPMIYGTTKHFLEVFDLKDLKDLPTPKEMAELGNTLIEQKNLPLETDVFEKSETDNIAPSSEIEPPENTAPEQ